MLQNGENIIWKGTTWPMGMCSPLCCSTVKWRITNKRIDYVRGCCGSTESTLDVRLITDLQLHRSCFQLIFGRGTLTIYSNDRTDSQIRISTLSKEDDNLLSKAEAEEIKEYHFHVYFLQDNKQNRASALALREKIFKLIEKGFFHPVPLDTYNDSPRGPHSIGSYEVWCPKEHFSRVYSWFALHHGVHSILIHPLTQYEVLDHSDRSAWMGKPVPLDLSKLPEYVDKIPLQYPELGLGYSAPNNNDKTK
ncbi:unnamed protein product [Rhizophagus irregularis]|nr:unnamed protein product [Rhizophagus irregularis]